MASVALSALTPRYRARAGFAQALENETLGHQKSPTPCPRVAFFFPQGQHSTVMSGCLGIPTAAAILVAGAAGAGGLLAPGPAAAAVACPKAETLPRVSLKTLVGRVTYDTRKSREQLARLQGRKGAQSRKRGWYPIGLTLTELQFRMDISINTLSRKAKRHCATIAGVKAELGYDEITIYVAKRYHRGSCQYLSVLEHENEHLAIFRNTLARYGPKVERRLVQAASQLKPMAGRSSNQAAAKIQKALQRQIEPLFKEMNKVMDRENDRIDMTENYHREQARCSKW